MKMKHCLLLLFIFVTGISLSACSSIQYYGQAISGQLEVLRARQPISDILDDPNTGKELAGQLKMAQLIRQYASDTLGMPDNESYKKYADLKRPYVVWNVVAAEEHSLSPLRHCFPFAGCVVYRGFFNESDAQDYANGLIQQGYEVYVYGVRAYSTLGWFDDPLLNTMLVHGDDLYLAALIFHELTHQVVYIKGASEFNESFATAVEMIALEQWLMDRGQESRIEIYQQRQLREQQFLNLVMLYKEKLEATYSDDSLSKKQKQNTKQSLYEALVSAYQVMKAQQWNGYKGYDKWFDNQLNNAKLAVVSTYHAQVKQVLEHYGNCRLSLHEYLAKMKIRLKKQEHIDSLLSGDISLCK